ncbi:MAG: hypothetical protein O3A47_13470 [Chloroflexi bacterium]|nr:hypothetical protein [Chloroflexota bacterium]
MAIQDPTGAVFQVWQPKNEIGAQVFGERGTLGWAELYTNDTSAAADFYSALFGWSASTVPGGGGQEYTLFQIEDRPATVMMAIREEWREMPPNWSIYYQTFRGQGSRRLYQTGQSHLNSSPALGRVTKGRWELKRLASLQRIQDHMLVFATCFDK